MSFPPKEYLDYLYNCDNSICQEGQTASTTSTKIENCNKQYRCPPGIDNNTCQNAIVPNYEQGILMSYNNKFRQYCDNKETSYYQTKKNDNIRLNKNDLVYHVPYGQKSGLWLKLQNGTTAKPFNCNCKCV